ncbi:hypothetical protein AB5I41_07575 [Sphingomonas sp. MMS24-JH45]
MAVAADRVQLPPRARNLRLPSRPARRRGHLAGADLALIVGAAECARIFGAIPTEGAAWHVPTDMRSVALAIAGCRIEGPHGVTLRLAKSIELLCMTFAALCDDGLVPVDGAGVLSAAEAQRIAAARRLIDEQWHEDHPRHHLARLRDQPGEADARLPLDVRDDRRRCDRRSPPPRRARPAVGDRPAGVVDRLSLRLSQQRKLHARFLAPLRPSAEPPARAGRGMNLAATAGGSLVDQAVRRRRRQHIRECDLKVGDTLPGEGSSPPTWASAAR